MKKYFLAFIAVIMCFPFASCGRETADSQITADIENQKKIIENAAVLESTPEPMQETVPLPDHEPGPYFVGYELHYADENGYDYKNCEFGVLKFDENGLYTSGNPELDELIKEELKKNVDPESQTRFEMLQTMYDYIVWNFGYGFSGTHDKGSTDWEVDDALQMLKKGRGNCYAYGALVTMVARNLGYQANAVAGTFKAGEHSWCEIEQDGEYYVCDAEFQACNDPYASRFFHTYEEDHSFNYQNPNRES